MGCECKFKLDLNQHAFLGGVLGIDVNGERQPISEDGIVDLSVLENTSEQYAKEAESWAVGGTGTRTGEDTDNAKYYSEMAEQQAATGGYLFFQVVNGDLMMTRTPNVEADFFLQDGDLYVEG